MDVFPGFLYSGEMGEKERRSGGVDIYFIFFAVKKNFPKGKTFPSRNLNAEVHRAQLESFILSL